MNNQWLIWNFERGMWWRPRKSGYTPYRKEAGRYDFEVARLIVKQANIHFNDEPEEAMIEAQDKELERQEKEAEDTFESDMYDLRTAEGNKSGYI